MAKRKATTEAQAEEEFNESHPEDDSQDTSESNSLSDGMTKADMIRDAISAGHTTGKPGVAYILEKYGVEVTPGTFAATKAQLKNRGEEAGATRARSVPSVQSQSSAASSTHVPRGLGADLKELKGIIDQLGGADEAKELLGQVKGLIGKYGNELTDMIDALS